MNMENEFAKIEKVLYAEAEKISPDSSGFQKVLDHLPESVTNKLAVRYKLSESQKGRGEENIFIRYLNNFMSSFWKIALPVGLVVIMVATFGYFRLTSQTDEVSFQPNFGAQVQFASAEVSETVDDIINETMDDEALLDADSEDVLLASYDDEALLAFNNLTTIYE